MLNSWLLIVCLLFSVVFSSAQENVWLVDPLESVFPDLNHLEGYDLTYKADVCKGSIAEVLIVVQLPISSELTVDAQLNKKSFPLENWSQLIDVPVEQNTGLDSRTEQYQGNQNPHVIRKAPFRIYEVIAPLDDKTVKTSNPYTALRFAVPIDDSYLAGSYGFDILLKSKGRTWKAKFKVQVHSVVLPSLSDSEFFYTNWFNLQQMEEKHSVDRWSDPWFEMLGKYADLMAYGRQNSIIIPADIFSYNDGELALDQSNLQRYIQVFTDRGFKYFEAPHLMNRGPNDDWGSEELTVALTGRKFYTDNGKKDIEIQVRLIADFVQTNGLNNAWLQHISDEPTSVNASCYKDVVKTVKEIYPTIKIMEATNDRDGIAGAIDIWCPLINDFQENESFFRQREELGEQVLVYTCLIPGGKWLNRTLDMEKLRQVYFGWGAMKYKTSGYLHWGLNQFKYLDDPFEQSVVHHPAPGAAPNNFLPAGDTHIIYPGSDGPLSSMRFEAHRLGCEDYELLYLLTLRNARKEQKLVSTLFNSYTDYTTSIKAYRKTKRSLLKELSN